MTHTALARCTLQSSRLTPGPGLNHQPRRRARAETDTPPVLVGNLRLAIGIAAGTPTAARDPISGLVSERRRTTPSDTRLRSDRRGNDRRELLS